MNIIVIIQARMGSSRLPGKVLMDLEGKSVLEHVIQRLKNSKMINDIIIATSNKEIDNRIVELCNLINIKCFRGSEDNVLERYYKCAKEYNGDIIVRVTSDCPLIDSKVLDEMLEFYLNNKYKFITNAGNEKYRTYPRGLDIEIFSFELLERAYLNSSQLYEQEHVTPYIYENECSIFYYKNSIDYSSYRLTLDTKEDYLLIKTIYNKLYKDSHEFYMNEIIQLLNENPELLDINKNIKQKSIK